MGALKFGSDSGRNNVYGQFWDLNNSHQDISAHSSAFSPIFSAFLPTRRGKEHQARQQSPGFAKTPKIPFSQSLGQILNSFQ